MTEETTKIVIQETIDGIPVDEITTTTESETKKKAVTPKEGAVIMNRPKSDSYIWGLYITLLFVSVVELYSASSTEVIAGNVYAPLIRHGVFLVMGLGIVLGLQKVHYVFFSRFAYIFAFLSLGMLVLTRFVGVTINGAQRAIMIAGFTIQPAEIAKLSIVILVATILGRNQEPRGVKNKGIAMAAGWVLVFAGLTWDSGLTNTVILMGVSVGMFLVGNIPLKKIGIVFMVYCVAGGCYMMLKHQNEEAAEFSKVGTTQVYNDAGAGVQNSDGKINRDETRGGRISRWLKGVNPDDKIDDMNRQIILARFAQANGGMFGHGPGNSRESARLPLAFSDYIYSIIIEDTGFVGGTILIIIYLCFIFRAGRVAFKCSRAFPAFLIMGCATLITLQALCHIAIVTGVAPVSGQPLPLISKGGTSVLIMSAAIGIMLSVSRYAVTSGNKQEIKAELKNLPSDLLAENVATQK